MKCHVGSGTVSDQSHPFCTRARSPTAPASARFRPSHMDLRHRPIFMDIHGDFPMVGHWRSILQEIGRDDVVVTAHAHASTRYGGLILYVNATVIIHQRRIDTLDEISTGESFLDPVTRCASDTGKAWKDCGSTRKDRRVTRHASGRHNVWLPVWLPDPLSVIIDNELLTIIGDSGDPWYLRQNYSARTDWRAGLYLHASGLSPGNAVSTTLAWRMERAAIIESVSPATSRPGRPRRCRRGQVDCCGCFSPRASRPRPAPPAFSPASRCGASTGRPAR